MGLATQPAGADLIADVGGTNARIAFVGPGGMPENVSVYPVGEYPSLEQVIENHLQRSGESQPRGACLAVAAPIDADRVRFTNSPWQFSISQMRRRFGFESLRVVNDFTAVAAALPRLGGSDISNLGQQEPQAHGTRAVVGPGTGLGTAVSIWTGSSWMAAPGEGGFSGFAPSSSLEREIVRVLLCRHPRVCNETILSGPGVRELYLAINQIGGASPENLTAEQIVSRAVQGDDPYCLKTVRVFVDVLAAFAGDMALIFGATGGVYLTGRIVRAMAGAINTAEFRQRFDDKHGIESYIGRIPVFLVNLPEPGLLGCCALLDAGRS